MFEDEKIPAYYTGRFRPFCKHHAEVVLGILQNNPHVNLTIAIADIEAGLSQENFLTGAEAEELACKTLFDLGITNVGTTQVFIQAGLPLEASLETFFGRTISAPTLIFSGSDSTIAACKFLSNKFPLRIIELPDDDSGQDERPKARYVRQGLIDGSEDWKNLVTPSVAMELQKPGIIQRIGELKSGVKRPWTSFNQYIQ